MAHASGGAYIAPMSTPVRYRRSLGLFSGTMAVVGGIIGAGIFLNPAIVAQRVGTSALTLEVWALGGAVALIGAFCFGELGQRLPQAGGTYVYLREGLGPLPAFLYAWALLLIIATGSIAAVAVVFANYTLGVLGRPDADARWLAGGAIALLTAVNYLGVKPGAITTNIFSLLKLAALGLLIVAGLGGAPGAITTPAPTVSSPPLVAVAAALVPVLFAYGGWQQTNFIAEEILEPELNLPRALVLGVAIVVSVYLLANVTYLRMLGPGGLATSTAPAADALRVPLGPVGGTLIGIGIAASTFGFLNLVIMVSPRVYQAMAADGHFFPGFAQLHPRFRTPSAAIVVQGAWAMALLVTGSYGALLDYVVFCDWIFFGLAVVALIVLRRRARAAGEADPPGAFRVPGWPATPLIFLLASAYVVAGSVASNPRNALLGVAILALGVPVFLFWRAPGSRTR
jgi:basic amino acid/polyamine antiporter, APA family